VGESAGESVAEMAGRHRLPRRAVPVALLVALAAAGVLLALPAPTPLHVAGPVRQATLASTWPSARVRTVAGALPNGEAYQLLMALGGGVSVGAASRPDSSATRLVLVGPGRPVRELAVVHAEPGFAAVTADAHRLYWAVTVPDAAGTAGTSLWSASRSGTGVHELVADAGTALFDQSQYDLQVAGGRLRWVTTAGATSVPVGGGSPTHGHLPSGYAPLAWPWFSNAGIPGHPALYDVATGRRVPVRAPHHTTVACSVAWCRTSGHGLYLMRPDGSHRQRLGAGSTAAPVVDVAPLARFEVLSVSAPAGDTGTPPQQILLYQIARHRTIQIAATATEVQARGGFLWWSTTAGTASNWHLLDLRALR
jgi:hypothetical protein